MKELVNGLLDLAGLLVLDPEVEVGVRQRAVDPLRGDDLRHALFALTGAQQGEAVVEVLPGRARIQVEGSLELLDRLLRGSWRLVERLSEISRFLQCDLLGIAPLGLGRSKHPPRGAASQPQGEDSHQSHVSTHPSLSLSRRRDCCCDDLRLDVWLRILRHACSEPSSTKEAQFTRA